jgi:hypothetical protein
VKDAADNRAHKRVFARISGCSIWLVSVTIHHFPRASRFTPFTELGGKAMGSSKPRSNVVLPAQAGGPGSGATPAVRCDIEGTLPAVLLATPDRHRLLCSLAVVNSEVIALKLGTPVAQAAPGAITDRLRGCLERGFEYVAELDTSGPAATLTVKLRR